MSGYRKCPRCSRWWRGSEAFPESNGGRCIDCGPPPPEPDPPFAFQWGPNPPTIGTVISDTARDPKQEKRP